MLLLSKSIAEFYARIFDYFKELLADLFFFPAFIYHCFRRHNRLRLVFLRVYGGTPSVKMVFHFTLHLNDIAIGGLGNMAFNFIPYAGVGTGRYPFHGEVISPGN